MTMAAEEENSRKWRLPQLDDELIMKQHASENDNYNARRRLCTIDTSRHLYKAKVPTRTKALMLANHTIRGKNFTHQGSSTKLFDRLCFDCQQQLYE